MPGNKAYCHCHKPYKWMQRNSMQARIFHASKSNSVLMILLLERIGFFDAFGFFYMETHKELTEKKTQIYYSQRILPNFVLDKAIVIRLHSLLLLGWKKITHWFVHSLYRIFLFSGASQHRIRIIAEKRMKRYSNALSETSANDSPLCAHAHAHN